MDPEDPAPRWRGSSDADPALTILVEPMLGVTLTPTMAHASDKVNVIPSRASLKIDCRVPPGHGEEAARQRIAEVLGDDADSYEIAFTEQVTGNSSPVVTEFMDAIDRWVRTQDGDAETVPVILPGFSDSRWFREAFPECVAYGFFPHAPHESCSSQRRSSTTPTSESTSATWGLPPASTRTSRGRCSADSAARARGWLAA